MRLLDKAINRITRLPSVQAAIAKAVDSAIALQPASAAQETRSSRASIVNLDEAKYGVSADVDTQIAKSDLKTYLELYQKLLWTFKGVNTKAYSLARVPLRIWEYISESERKEFRIHPIYKLLRNPNNLNTRFEMTVKTVAYLELCGNAYWFLERDKYGLPEKIHLPRPDRVKPEPVDKSDVSRFQLRSSSGGVETWLMTDVVHFTHFNPLSDFQGFPTVAAGQDNAIIELYLILFGKRFFQNAIYPSQIFKTSSRLSDATFERFHAELRRLHQGVESFHKALLLEEDIEPVDDRRKSPADSDYVESRRQTREDILAGLGCYHLVALLQGKTGSALRDATRMFWEDTMRPLMNNIEETISKELLWSNYPDSENLIAEFDTRRIEGLREDALSESLAFYRYWQMGVYTPNEIRKEIGLDGKVDWGDDPPPTIPKARSRTLPNEERAFLESAMPHPERYQKMEARLDDAAMEIAFELGKETGNGSIDPAIIKNILMREWEKYWTWEI